METKHDVPPPPDPKGFTKPLGSRDWPSLVFLVLLLVWIHLTSLAIHWIVWTIEQFFIVGGIDWPIWVWPLIALAHVFLLAAPLLPLGWFWRPPRYRAAFQTWAVASLFILFMIPARFAPPNAAQLAAVLQIGGTLAYLAFVAALIGFRQRRGGRGFIKPQGPTLPALLLAPLLAYSWIAWGALGSVLDVVLNLLAALLFGLAAGLVIGHFVLAPLRRTSLGSGWDITLGGFVAGASLLMMGSGLGFNGLQLFLMLTLPVLGRTLLALSRLGRERAEMGWLALALLVGLAAAAPMLLVDPDELVLVLNVGSRDVWVWTFRAALVTACGTWTLGMVLFLLRNRLSRWRWRSGERPRKIAPTPTLPHPHTPLHFGLAAWFSCG